MTNVIEFKRSENAKKKKQPVARKAHTLCKEGHHKWKVVQEKQFDTRSGKLVTIFRCSRCEKQKVKLL